MRVTKVTTSEEIEGQPQDLIEGEVNAAEPPRESHKSLSTGDTGTAPPPGISTGIPPIQRSPVVEAAERSSSTSTSSECSFHLQIYDDSSSSSSDALHSICNFPTFVESEITIPFEDDKTFLKPSKECPQACGDDKDKLLMPPPSNPPTSPLKFRRRGGAHQRTQSCPAPISSSRSNRADHQGRVAILKELRTIQRSVSSGNHRATSSSAGRSHPMGHKTPDLVQSLPKLNELLLSAVPILYHRQSKGASKNAHNSEGPGTSRDLLKSPAKKSNVSVRGSSVSGHPSLRQLLDFPVPGIHEVTVDSSSDFPQNNKITKIPVPMLSPGSLPKQDIFQGRLQPTSLHPLTFQTPQSNLSTPASSSESEYTSSSELLSDDMTDHSSEASPSDETSSSELEHILKCSQLDSPSEVEGTRSEEKDDSAFGLQLAEKFHMTFNKTLQKERLDYMMNEPLKVPRDIWLQAVTAVMLAVVSPQANPHWTPYQCFDQLMTTAKWILGGAVHMDLQNATFFQFVELERCFFPQHQLAGSRSDTPEAETCSDQSPISQSSICPAICIFPFLQWKSLALQLIRLTCSDEQKALAIYENLQQLIINPPRRSSFD